MDGSSKYLTGMVWTWFVHLVGAFLVSSKQTHIENKIGVCLCKIGGLENYSCNYMYNSSNLYFHQVVHFQGAPPIEPNNRRSPSTIAAEQSAIIILELLIN